MTTMATDIPELRKGARLFLYGEALGTINAVLYDGDHDPLYFTDDGGRAHHFEVTSGQVTQGRREHHRPS